MDARPEQALVRIDVSDPDHDPGVHQQQLDAGAAAARGLVEELRREPIAERLHTELREQRVAGGVAGFPQHHAEAARIAQAQRGGAENQVHVIVIARKGSRVDRAQASRHAQVHDERTGVALEQQILSAPLQALHPLADEYARKLARNALAQIGIAHHDARDRFAEHERLDAAAGDLDFRQLWHGWNPMSLSAFRNIPKLALYDSKRLHAQSPEPVAPASRSLAALRSVGARPV